MLVSRLTVSAAILLHLTALLLAAPPVSAQSGSDNAADIYREAFAIIQSLPPEDSVLLSEYRWGEIRMTPAVRAALSRAQPAIRLIQRAATIDRADWGIDYTQGPATLLPHLAPMRASAALLAAEAQARLESGDTRGAASLYATTYRISDHVTDDPVLINSLVGLAINTLSNNLVEKAIAQGLLGPAESRLILEAAMPVASADDPLGLVASIEGERDCFSTWLQDNFMGEGGLERFLEEMAPMYGMLAPEETAGPLLEMEQTAFDTAILSYDLALEHAIAAVAQEDLGAARREMARIAADAEAGVYGPLALMLLPSLDRCLASFIRGYAQFDSTIEKLEELRDDPEAQVRLRNAAHWYLRAIREWNLLPEDARTLIREAAAPARRDDRADRPPSPLGRGAGGEGAPEPHDAPDLDAALLRAQPIIAILLEAAEIERCNFDIDNTWRYSHQREQVAHLPGMRDLATLLSAAARRRAARDQPPPPPPVLPPDDSGSATRLAAIFRMAHHLGMDGQVSSTRAAVDIASIGQDSLREFDEAMPADADREKITGAIAELARGRFGLTHLGRRYPESTIDWLIEEGGESLASGNYLGIFAFERSDAERAAFIAAIDGMTTAARSAMLKDLLDLVKATSGHLARTGRLPDDWPAPRAAFDAAHPPVIADWIIGPLENAVRAVEDALRDIAGGS